MAIWATRRASLPLTEEQIKGLLKRYDTNGDGKLSKKELQLAFYNFGSRCSWWRARRALRHADDNGDGFVSDEEMQELVKYALKRGYVIN